MSETEVKASGTRSRVVTIALIVLVAGAVATNLWTMYGTDPPENNPNFPDGVHWICENPQCQAEFTMSGRELHADEHASKTGRPRCPKCRRTGVAVAYQCRYCKRHWARPRSASRPSEVPTCPHCKRPVVDRKRPQPPK